MFRGFLRSQKQQSFSQTPFSRCLSNVISPGSIRKRFSFYICYRSKAISLKYSLFSNIIRSLKNIMIELGVFFRRSKARYITFSKTAYSLKIRLVTTCRILIFLVSIIFSLLISTIAKTKKNKRNLSFSDAMKLHSKQTRSIDNLLI